jgi:hypothetical protein
VEVHAITMTTRLVIGILVALVITQVTQIMPVSKVLHAESLVILTQFNILSAIRGALQGANLVKANVLQAHNPQILQKFG